ncbi:hypothetical protein [Nonomuraea sp. NPDC049158]|uniref:hypothetical protein n=1 Tax=Nonomuraea sp. NPDC049158 TaxID=3155649 RepID=UPI0033E3A1E2
MGAGRRARRRLTGAGEPSDRRLLREIAIFLTHYIGWPLGAELGVQIGTLIAEHEKRPKSG